MKKLLRQLSVAAFILPTCSLHATLLFWSGNGSVQGGAGTWDTTTAHFGTSTAGPFTTVWNNANTDDATVDNGTGTAGSIVLSGAINMNGALTLNAASGTAAYTIDGTGTMVFGAGSTLNTAVTRSFNARYAGTVTKTGAGTVTFNNASGSVTKFILKAGSANYASPSRFGTGADAADFLTFDGGTLSMNTTTSWTMGRSITVTANSGTISKANNTITCTLDKAIHGTGTLSLSGGGFYVLSSTASDFSGTLGIAGSTTVQCGAAGVVSSSCIVNPLASGGNLNLNGFDQTVGGISGTAGSMVLGANTLTINDGLGASYTSVISGAGGKVIKNGSGSQQLGGSSTFTGGVTLNAGAIGIAGTAGLGTGTLTVNNSPTLSANNTSGRAMTIPVQLNGDVTIDDTFNAGPGQIAFDGSIWNLSAGTHTITVNRAAGTYTVRMGHQVTESGAANIIKAGNGTLNLTNALNNFSGTVTVNNGAVQMSYIGALGTTAGKTTVNSGGALSIGNSALAVSGTVSEPLELAGSGSSFLNLSALDINNSSVVTFDQTVTLLADATVAVTGTGVCTFNNPTAFSGSGTTLSLTGGSGAGAHVISGAINIGSGGITKTGGGAWTLTAANTYTGPTAVSGGGVLSITTPSALGSTPTIGITGSGNGLFAGTRLQLNGGITVPSGPAMSIATTASPEARGGIESTNGNNTFNGTITLTGDGRPQFTAALATDTLNLGGNITGSSYTGTIKLRGPGTGNISGQINLGAGTVAGIELLDGGTWTISSTGNSWSNLQVSTGTVKLGANNALPTGSSLTLGSSSFNVADTFDLSSFNQQIAGLATAGSGTPQLITNSVASTTSTLTYSSVNPSTFSGLIAGNGTRQIALTVAAGTLTLSGTQTYGGDTTITGGTLALSGSTSINNSPNIIVASGGIFDVSAATGGAYTLASGQTLKGFGSVTGTIVVPSGATLAPGGSIGTLTFNNSPSLAGLTLMEIDSTAAPNADKVLLTSGMLTYGGTLTVNNIGPALVGGEAFVLFGNGPFSGSFATMNLPVLGAGLNWWDQLLVNGTLTVNRAPSAQDKAYNRQKGLSLKIAKSDLLTGASDLDSGDSVSYDSLISTGTQGATVTEDASFVYYSPANDNDDTLSYRVKDARGGFSAAKNIAITVVNGTGMAQSITVSGGVATVTFAGIPTFAYDVQRSTNMVDWVTILTTNAPAQGLFQVSDNFADLGVPPDPAPGSAFYRLHQP